MPTIPFTKWMKNNKLKKRDAYRLIERGVVKPIKELRTIRQTRQMWVLCIDESVKPE
jgi:hypothetical protein